MSWSLKQLRDDVELLFGADQQELLSPCVDSIVDRMYYARFHFQDGMRPLKAFLDGRDDQSSLFSLIVGADGEQSGEFYLRKKHAEAHIVACLQSMHALSDTLGHVLYFSTGQNLNPNTRLQPRAVSIHSVRTGLLKLNPKAIELEQLTGQLIDNPDYQYVADIVNHSKHRSIIGASFTVGLTDSADPPYGLEFRAFEYNGKKYPKRWVESFLENEYGRQSALIIQIGVALNKWVREKCALAGR